MKNQLIGILLLVVSCTIFAQRPASTPQMNTPEMQQIEAELAEFQEELKKLSPQEQEEFFKSMEEAVKKIDDLSKTDEGKALLDKLDKGSISDEELDQLINQIVGEEEEIKEAAPVVEEPKEAPKPVVKPKPISSKHEQAIDTINAIIAHSNAFIVKAATIPELPGKIMKWQKHKLVDWQPGLTWNKLKTDIEQFVSNLNILLERDQKTKEYYHLDELIKEEMLYNKLKKIQHVVSEYEPQIEEISPLHKSLAKESKRAFQKMLSQYSEALYTLHVIEELKKLVERFQPKAKIAREEEEKAFQKAEQEKKKKLMPGAPITVGRSEPDYVPAKKGTREPRGTPTPTHPVYYPSASTETSSSSDKSTDTGAAKGKEKGKTADKAKEKDTKDKKEKEEEGKEDEKEEKNERLSALKKQAEKIEEKTFKEADAIVEKIADNLQNVAATLKKTTFFDRLEKHVMDDSDIDYAFALEIMPELMRELSMRRGVLGNLEQLQKKVTTQIGRTKYQEKLKTIFDKYKNQIDPVLQHLTTIEGQWQTLDQTMPKSKQYVYFAQEIAAPEGMSQEDIDAALDKIEEESTSVEEGLQKAVDYLETQKPTDSKLMEAQQKVPTPISILELKKNMATLKDMISNFDKVNKETKK